MTENKQDEEVEIDLNHPWIQAALALQPQPVPTGVNLVPVSIPGPDGKKLDGAMMTVMTTVGVTTVFLAPSALSELMQNSAQIFQYWEQNQNTGLIVADKTMQRAAQQAADAQAAQNLIIKGQ